MRTIRKAFVLLIAFALVLAVAMPAFATSTKVNRVVSNVIVVLPPKTTDSTETPIPTLDPEATIDPEEVLDPEATVDPDAELETDETDETEGEEPDTGISSNGFIIPEDARVEINAKIRQNGDEPAFGDHVRLESELVGLDGYTVDLQWQQCKPQGEWFDLADAKDASITFVMTSENARDSWRLAVVVVDGPPAEQVAAANEASADPSSEVAAAPVAQPVAPPPPPAPEPEVIEVVEP